MAIASLQDIQEVVSPNPSAPPPVQASAVSQAGTASLDDVQTVHPAPSIGPSTASLDDVIAVHESSAPAPKPEPSTWDKIKSFATHPILGLEAKAIGASQGVGELAGEAAMLPLEVPILLGESAQNYFGKMGHPTLAKVAGAYTGGQKAVLETVQGMTSPLNIGLMAATGGLSQMEGVAAQTVSRLTNAGFTLQQLYQAYKTVPEIRDALKASNVQEAARLITSTAGNIGMAGMAARGTLAEAGKAAAGKSEAEAAKVEPKAPAIIEQAPAVHIADDVGKTQAEAKATTHHLPPTPDDMVRIRDSAGGLHDVPTERLEDARALDSKLKVVSGEPQARIVSEDHIPVVSKNEVLAEVTQRILNNSAELNKVGLDPSKIESRADVETMLNRAADHIQQSLDPRVGITIGFEAQKALASELGMTVEDLLSRPSGEAFSAEKAIAARALLKASQTDVMNLARIAATGDKTYQAEFTKALAQHQEIISQVRGVTSEAGRALGSFRIGEAELPEARISAALAGLSPKAQLKAAQLLSKIDPTKVREVNDFIQQIKPSSTPDKIFEAYRNSLLSSPATVIKKGVSEIAMMGLEAAKKFVASGMAEDRYAGESWAYAKGAVKALRHLPAVLRGEFDLQDMPSFEPTHQQAIKGTVGKVLRAPSTLISRQTNAMYMLNYMGEIEAQAARAAVKEGLSGNELAARQEYLSAHPTEEMRKAAHEIGLHNTFQSELGKGGKAVNQAIQKTPGARFVFPFFKTPINLVKTAFEYSPYGLLKASAGGKEFGEMGEKMPQAQQIELAARGLVGSSIAAGLALLAMEGHVTGGGQLDYKKRQTLQATGWQPYSIKVGGKYYSYHRGEPLGLVLGTIADIVHSAAMGNSDEEVQSKANQVGAYVARNVDDLPFLTTLSSITSSLHGEAGTKLDRIIAHLIAGGVIPAGVADIAQTVDPTVRRPDDTQGLWNATKQTAEQRIPGLTKNVPPALDITGQPVQYPQSRLGGANPFPVSSAKGDPVLSELARLGVSTPPLPTKVSIGQGKFKKTVQLSKGQSVKIAAEEGAAFRNGVAGMMNQPAWKMLTDESKVEQLKRVHEFIEKSRVMKLRMMGILPLQ